MILDDLCFRYNFTYNIKDHYIEIKTNRSRWYLDTNCIETGRSYLWHENRKNHGVWHKQIDYIHDLNYIFAYIHRHDNRHNYKHNKVFRLAELFKTIQNGGENYVRI